MPRLVNVFEDQPVHHCLEVEVVDYDSGSIAYTIFGHEDPRVATVMIGSETYTRSREALRTMFQRLLDDIDRVPAQPKPPQHMDHDKMTYPLRLMKGCIVREAAPGETINLYLAAEEGTLAMEDSDGTPLVVTVNSENAARILGNQTPFSCSMLPAFPWKLLAPIPATTGHGAPRQRFQFAA